MLCVDNIYLEIIMRDKKRRPYIKRVILVICVLIMSIYDVGMAAGISETTSAELPQAVSAKKSAAVKLVVYAADQNQKKYNIRQGTGVLIGTKEESGETSEMILTSDKLTVMEESELNNVRLKHGISVEEDLDIRIDLILEDGIRIETEERPGGDGFVVLDLKTDISGIAPLSLGSSAAVNMNDKLYMLGYGGNKDILGQEELGNLELEYRTGIVSSIDDNAIMTDYEPQTGNIGMPVLNVNGYVVGMYVQGDEGLYIKPVDSIKKTLDILSIPYLGIDTDNHYNEATEEMRQQLNDLLLECQNLTMQTDVYTEKSIKKLKESISTAMAVIDNPESTYDEYQSAIEGLEKAKGKLKKVDYPIRVVQFGLAAAIVLVLILSMRTQYKINQLQEDNKYNLGGSANSSDVIYAKLIRMDTMQEIPISNVIFRIGKSIGDVDYVIEDNTSISRHHADIMRKGKEFFVMDNNSTNHTFVNGEQIISGQYVPIKGGDSIRLADMDFRFEI